MRTNGNHKSTIRSAKKKKTPKRNDVLEREKKKKGNKHGIRENKKTRRNRKPNHKLMGPRKVRDFTAKKKEKKTENDKEKTIRVNNQIHI